jgi:hypothetical protein
MLNPVLLCKNHLLGEHSEIHKHRHVFVKQYKIDKRISPIVQICPEQMKIRHDMLAQEMIKRGYNHKSPYELPDLSYLSNNQRYAIADILYNIRDLFERCDKCKDRIKNSLYFMIRMI